MKSQVHCLCATQIFLTISLAANVSMAQTPPAVALGSPTSGTIAAAGEVDWYTVTTDTVGDLSVSQTAWPPYIETRIAIYGPNSQLLLQSNPTTAAAPGTYYVKVWSATNGVSTAVYTFTANLAKAGTGNDIDGGKNNALAAVPIVLGTPVSGTIAPSKETAGSQDMDWFTVTTDEVGDLAVSQTVWPPYIETRIAIFGPNSATLAQNNPVMAAAPGTYYIKVWSATDGSSILPYTFACNLEKAKTGNDIDKGSNSALGAVPIVLGTPVTDTIAPSKATAGKQDVDWFTLTTSVAGELTVTQSVWPPYIETRIAIFGPNLETLAQENPVKAAVPGIYYIKVWSATDGSSIAPYVFTAKLAPDPGSPVVEAGPSDAGAIDSPSEPAKADAAKTDVVFYDGGTDNLGTGAERPDGGAIDGRAFSDSGAARDATPPPLVDSAVPPLATKDGGTGASSGSSGGGCSFSSAGHRAAPVCVGLALLGLTLLAACRRRKPSP